MTSKDMTNAISSPESEDGATRSDSPDGPMTDLFGQPVVLAHHSVSPESRRSAQLAKARVLSGALEELASQYALTANTLGLPMPATYGRKFGDSQLNLDLDAYSENRLTVWEHSTGSPLYRHHLRFSATPLGRRVCRLQALERRTFGSDCGGWPTPTAHDHLPQSPLPEHLAAYLGNPSPRMRKAGWPTPTASDATFTLEQALKEAIRKGPTNTLGTCAALTGWATPKILGRQVNLSPAMTAKRGVLNPAFSLWLMGYPKHWMAAAPSRASVSLGAQAMQSSPNAQPDLSEPGSDT